MVKAGKQEDKKILSAVKKFNPQPLDGIVEANMFKDDFSVLHFTKPSSIFMQIINLVQYAVKESFLVISGTPETKSNISENI